MFTKILVLAASVAIVSGTGYHYPQKSLKTYILPYEHRIPVQEPSSEEYKPVPVSQGQAYSSESLAHQGHTVAYEESHGPNADHDVPVYQYQVNEQSEDVAPVHKAPVQQMYKPHYQQHDIQTVRIPSHHKAAYYPESYAHKVPVYHSESHEHKAPYYQLEPYEAQNQNHHFRPESHDTPAYHISHEPTHSEPHAHEKPVDYYAYPKYQYEYKVEDPNTGDNKFQHEIRDGDVVKGIYGLQDADGSFRTVEYSSDKHHGFSATVKHSAPGQHVHIESHHPNEHEQKN